MNSRVESKSDAAASAASPTTRRLNLILSQRAYDDAALTAKAHNRSMTEIVRLGLGLVKLALDAAANGDRIVIADKDGNPKREIVLP
jgi:hypothetical protein